MSVKEALLLPVGEVLEINNTLMNRTEKRNGRQNH